LSCRVLLASALVFVLVFALALLAPIVHMR
jgi:hypothetical protein